MAHKHDEAAEVERIMAEGIDRARAFLQIGCDSPHGTPLREEMRQAALDALAWVNDDDVIDALYDADRREMEWRG